MRPCTVEPMNEEGVTRLMEYIIITGVLLLLMVVMMFSVNASIMEGPADKLRYHAFVDIGNGVSTRIVDLYVIAPGNGTIATKFDIPDDVAGKGYFVNVAMEGASQAIQVQGGDIKSQIAIAGIGATKGVVGNTTGAGWNMIQYDSKGF
ncbi:hypothetical protein [Methanoculleus sp. 7T]|uniref:hypothetical protein n=1 Tax=Methanoculleus sp. 7T TaxID=2937282 RepID=UPI0020C0F618|nr:hypothetical protein [Methanoculleus sp. 7T]MCK8518632.1 hypothetical protein [Methanoculleus sp. 7T]